MQFNENSILISVLFLIFYTLSSAPGLLVHLLLDLLRERKKERETEIGGGEMRYIVRYERERERKRERERQR